MKKTSSALKVTEAVMRLLLTVCGLAAVGFVIVITGYLVVSGIPAIQEIGLIDFLTGTVWKPNQEQFGILPVILTSVLGTFGAILIGVPLGLLFAILSRQMAPEAGLSGASPDRRPAGGHPVGRLRPCRHDGARALCPRGVQRRRRRGPFSSIIVLTVMVLPSIISVSETALKAVPREYEEASLALGATWNETVFKVTFPAAKSGIAASVVLGIGRAVGEAMAIMMVCGNVANMPSLFSSVRFLTTAIAGEMSYSSGLHRQALFSIALILYCFIMIINMILNFFLKKKEQ